MADAIMEIISSGPNVYATDATNGDRYEQLEKQVAELTREIAKFNVGVIAVGGESVLV